MSIEIFVQARMGSTRLPGKVLKPVLGRPLLDFLVERLKQSQETQGLVILTTTQPMDDVIEQFCQTRQIDCFRGAEEDVLDRYYQAALQRRPEGIVRITADCPLIDPDVLDKFVRIFRQGQPEVDYVANGLQRTFPVGLDVEVFSFQALEKAFQEAHRPEEREHVTVYIYRHPEKFVLKTVEHHPSLAHYRWTVDTPEDFELVKHLLEEVYPKNPCFRLEDLLQAIKRHPEWSKINAHIQAKKLPDIN